MRIRKIRRYGRIFISRYSQSQRKRSVLFGKWQWHRLMQNTQVPTYSYIFSVSHRSQCNSILKTIRDRTLYRTQLQSTYTVYNIQYVPTRMQTYVRNIYRAFCSLLRGFPPSVALYLYTRIMGTGNRTIFHCGGGDNSACTYLSRFDVHTVL